MDLQAEAEEVDQAAGQQDVHQREEQRHHLWEDVELVVGGQLGQTEHQPAGHLGDDSIIQSFGPSVHLTRYRQSTVAW